MQFPIRTDLFFRSEADDARSHAPPKILIRGKISPRADLLISLAGILTLLVIWCVLTYFGFVSTLFLPKPTAIVEGLAEFHRRDWLIPAIWRSFWRVTRSLLLVISIGVPIGIIIGAFTPVDAFFRKIINGAKSVPTTGIAGLIVLWFGVEERAMIMFLFLGAIFYMIILVKNAIKDVNEEYLRVALDIGANRWQMITRVLLPAALPQIWDAIAVCNGIMWTYIVLAEFLNSNEEHLGLGFLLNVGSRNQSSGKVFGMLIIIAAISALTDFVLHTVRKRFLNW
jgi:NitT/TauT family transport system permease protein